ncbi:Acetylcholine receptor subunit alpha-L1 [Hypsibius exemplaris]|uniref:Acetylcholine receptor subunit alpha-L1 n=1 Tax=Hypsibius exemplaris TaxID=2072580 RepID=A0A9X6RL06_HYPEX|nr:Acetylcholine receptor subunit alpha-L1 [Hypsibius exemplaris]
MCRHNLTLLLILCCCGKVLSAHTFPAETAPINDTVNNHTDEQRLLYHIMRHYDKNVRPVHAAASTVSVRLRITLTHIFDLDERNQVLTTMIWLNQEWQDELLTWNPADFSGLRALIIPCQSIWLPDIVLFNNADDYNKGYMQSRAMLHHDGKVYWPPPTKMRSTCKVDVRYFPFDTQECLLKFGSGSYDGLQMNVLMMNQTGELVDLKHYVKNGEWELQSISVERTTNFYDSFPTAFPHVTFKLVIRRKVLYYVYNVIFPTVMMSVMTLLVFVLPPDSGEKIALGIIELLAFSVSILKIAEKLPETSDSVSLIDIYLTFVTAMASLSVMMTVVVITVDWRQPERYPVPEWVKRVFLGKVAHFICIKTDHNSYRRKESYGFVPDEPRPLQSAGSPRCSPNEWRQVAQVMDRCFFLSFSVATAVATIVLLVILPMLNDKRAAHPIENTL